MKDTEFTLDLAYTNLLQTAIKDKDPALLERLKNVNIKKGVYLHLLNSFFEKKNKEGIQLFKKANFDFSSFWEKAIDEGGQKGLEILALLSELDGDSINKPLDEYGNTPLHVAYKKLNSLNGDLTKEKASLSTNEEEIKIIKTKIEILKEKGADTSILNEYGLTPLTLALGSPFISSLYKRNYTVADDLKDRFPEVLLAKTVGKMTTIGTLIFMETNASKKEDYIQAYIDVGGKINAQTKKGTTALHIAASIGDIKTIELLKRKGADPTIKDNKGNTPLDIAKSHSRGTKVYEELNKPAEKEN